MYASNAGAFTCPCGAVLRTSKPVPEEAIFIRLPISESMRLVVKLATNEYEICYIPMTVFEGESIQIFTSR